MRRHPVMSWVITGAAAAGIAGLNLFLPSGNTMALLLTLSLWVSLAQGAVALCAAVETAGSDWIDPVKQQLLALYPMILLVPALFPLFIRKINYYPWADHPTAWLQPRLFLFRNMLIFSLTFIAAGLYRRASLARSPRVKTFAVLYLFAFVISQSMMAFDWVMPLDYPWISTLLGPYFFVEALYLAMAFTGLYFFFISRNKNAGGFQPYRPAMRDTATLTFGFSLFWAGLFYSQYLVIWYGHIPEETAYFLERLAHSPIREMALAVVPVLFVIPFLVLMPRVSRNSPAVFMTVSVIIIAGIAMERYVMIAPKAPVHPGAAALETVLMIGVSVYLFLSPGTAVTSGNPP